MKCTQNMFKLVSVFIIHILVYLCNKEYKDTFFNTALMDQNYTYLLLGQISRYTK